MPDSTLPRWARAIGRGLRATAGVLAALLGIGDLLAPSVIVTESAGAGMVVVWATVCLVFGVMAAVAVLLHRWRWEMVAASILALALAVRAAAVWLSVEEGFRLAAAAGITLAALLFLLRTIDLLVFAVKVSAGVRFHARQA